MLPRRKIPTAVYFISIVTIVAGLFLLCISTSYFDTTPTMTTPSADALYLDSAQPIDARVADLLARMTLDEKIGQMTLVEKNSLKELTDVSEYSLGALLSGSGAKPTENTFVGWKEMTDTYQAQAAQSRLAIPLLYGSDAIHGHAHVAGATIFPHMIGLGAAGDAELVRKIGAATAQEMKATGVNWNFAPNLDTPQDIRWGRVYETFSDDPALVSKLGAAFIEGLQTVEDRDTTLQILGTPKHFVGLGGMQWETSLNENYKIDQGVTATNETLLNEVYLPPFQSAIDAGALSVMVGLNTWGDTRTVRQKYLLTDVLKKQMGFKGFIVSDWYGVHEGTKNTFLASVKAINAGVDMVMLPFDYQTFARHLKWANRLHLVSDSRIDDAVSRILYAKFSLGLFDETNSISTLNVNPNEAHQKLARTAVAQSLVLLKNEDAVLPLKPSVKKIHVAGSAADNVGRQAGAWSVEWQGVDGNWLPNSTSLLTGIKEVASPGTQIEYQPEGNFPADATKAEVGIAIVGESPYAEGWGDNPSPSLSEEDLAVIENVRQTSKTVVVILVTGRPLFITNEIERWDALVVAWLPGTQGAGVADVLFGKTPVTGTLPLPWPATPEQLPIKPTGETSDGTAALFLRYFGLK